MSNLQVFDNGGKTVDRYTLVYLDTYMDEPGYTQYECFGFAPDYWYPDSFGQHGYCRTNDRGTLTHLGKMIEFAALPEETRSRLAKDELDQ